MAFHNWKNALYARFFGSGTATNEEMNRQITSSLLDYSRMPLSEVFKYLQTSEKGLNQKDVYRRLKQYGLNQIAHEKPPTWYALLLSNFANPFVLLLIFLGIVSFFLGEKDAVVIIACM